MLLSYYRMALMAAVVLVLFSRAEAGRTRFRYVPEAPGSSCLRPVGTGERLTLLSWEPYKCPPPRPTRQVGFRHPATGQTVTVPLALPNDTPRMEYVSDRTIFNYGSDTVQVVFLPDGTVYVVYSSGLLRAPW